MLIFDTTAIAKARFTSKRDTFEFSTMFTKIKSMTKIRILAVNHFMNFFIDNRSNVGKRRYEIIPIISHDLFNSKFRHNITKEIITKNKRKGTN